MKLRQTSDSEDGFDRYIKFRGKEYDFDDRPVIWYFLLTGVLSVTFAGFAAVWFVLILLWEGLNKVFQAIPHAGDLVAGLISLWILLGIVKYALTGTAAPFFTVDIDLNISTEGEEDEG